jgi:hypothetical protein
MAAPNPPALADGILPQLDCETKKKAPKISPRRLCQKLFFSSDVLFYCFVLMSAIYQISSTEQNFSV